ncbi:PREDICTED: cuticle protein 14-like, partial [Rhagoletis zephyria]|uniref:cuticle protein 14-like n=1 Tax=Rhagoletis zephyria TaxID=28612 RepID=UPI00081169A1
MKFLILFAVVATASANIVNTGSSAVQRSDDGHGNYEFGYNEDHATGGTFRKEKGGPGYMTGSYGLRDHDGRVRTVNYVADAHGYRAQISTNEPGVDPKQDPAAASINGAHGGYGIAAGPILAAPAIASYAAGPIAAAGPIGYAGGYGAGKGYGGEILGGYGAPSAYSVGIQHASIAAPVAYAAGK